MLVLLAVIDVFFLQFLRQLLEIGSPAASEVANFIRIESLNIGFCFENLIDVSKKDDEHAAVND